MLLKTKRRLEAMVVILAIALVVATTPNRYFLGQESDIPQVSLSNDTPGITLRAVVRFESDPGDVEPCFATFRPSAQNNGDAVVQIHYWSLAGPWDGTFPPETSTDTTSGEEQEDAEETLIMKNEELFSGEIDVGERDGTAALTTPVSFAVPCQWQPFNFLVFAQSGAELDVELSGTLRVDTSAQVFPDGAPSTPLSCGGTEVDDTDENMRIQWLE
jgi:hypothetical protein